MTAIDELIAMADDAAQPSAIRAEALRGLGLLGAAEELPRLVRALTDSDETIRKAAREAIDRLHADDGQPERDE
jgi:HEAT repeat protein